MRRSFVIAASAVAVAFAVGVLGVPAATTATLQTPQLAAPPATIVQYGYVRSLVRTGSRYRMRFDPALWLSGQTANRAAIEDGVIPPGESVPNDYYIRNESRKQLTYTVLPGAQVTVVTTRASEGCGRRGSPCRSSQPSSPGAIRGSASSTGASSDTGLE